MWKTDFSGIQGKDPALACRVETVDGVPRLFIGGKETAPFLFFGNSEAENWEPVLADEIRMAAGRGIHLHSLVLHLPYIAPGTDWRQADFSHFQKVMDYCIAADPEALVFPRICMHHPGVDWWREHHPEALAVYATGKTGGPNIASEEWLKQETDALLAMLEYVRAHPDYDRRIVGYHIFPQYVGEWMSMNGHCDGVDLSEANRAMFNSWLKERYGTDEALSAAWGRRERLGQAAIPVPPNNVNFQEECRGLFLDVEKQRDVLDVYDYISDLTARRIEELSEVIKRGTNGKSLVMHFYGYLFELGDPKTGHQALRQVLNSPYVDVLCSPVGYLDRLAGGVLSLMAPVDSVHAHGKLWMVEDDTKTHLEPPSTEDYGDPFNHRIETAWDTAMIHKRNMAVILSRGLGVWWMDLWSHGWLRDEGIWENIESLCAFYQAYLPQLKGGYSPEVAVVGDEDGIKAFRDPWNQAKAVLQQNMPALYRSGVSFGLYLLDDVLDGRAAADCKLYIIIGAYRLTRDKAERLKARLHRDGKTVLWLYGADTAARTFSEEVTGFRTEALPGERRPLLEGCHPEAYAYAVPVAPVYAVTDPDARCLARFQGTDACGFAVKDMGTWTSLYYGGLSLSEEAIRQAAAIAGAHVFADGNDVLIAGQGFIGLYARSEGVKTLRLPGRYTVYDEEGRPLCGPVSAFEVTFRRHECRYYTYR